jgi:hypothetical protein
VRHRSIAAAALGLVAGWSAPLHAQEPPLRWEAQVKMALMYFRYEEFEDGRVLDREIGYLPGVSAGFGRVSGPWGAFGELAVNVGTADYTGETTGAHPGIPVTTKTSERIFNAHARLERWSSRDAQWRAAGYAGLGYRGWNRDVSGTRIGNIFAMGVAEYYETAYWMIGAKAASGPEASQWTLDLRLQRTLRPQIRIESTPSSDALTLRLGERTTPAASLGWQSRNESGSVLTLELFFEQWEFGRSPPALETLSGVPTGFVVHEPESRTRSYGLRAGVTRAF